MGYELNKLMEQYGVSTPGLAPKSSDMSQAQYDKYKQAYSGRISATPMYTDPQFYTGPSEAVKKLGEEQVKKDILEAIPNLQNISGQGIRNLMDKYGATGYDLAKARGTSGMWGAPLTYSDFITGTPSIFGSLPTPVPGTDVENNMLYKGLTPQSTPEQISAAYSQYIGSRGGDIEANKKSAVDYLTNLGLNENAINQAYGVFKSGNYAKGGAVTQYQTGGLNEEPIAMPQPTTTPVSPAANDLMNMISRYTGPSVYEPELKAARARHAEENQNLINMINQMSTQQQAGPSKSEMYFRLAAALGQPTRSGTFAETLGNVSQAMAEHQREVNAAQQLTNAQKLQMMLQAQQMKAAGAKEELASLQGLTQQEMQDKRALMLEALKSQRPKTDAERYARMFGAPGTPEHDNAFVDFMDRKTAFANELGMQRLGIAQQTLGLQQLAHEQKQREIEEQKKLLTKEEVKARDEKQNLVDSIKMSLNILDKAYRLNPNTLDSSWIGLFQRGAMQQVPTDDPRILATKEQANLLGQEALSKLKHIFGGTGITDAERKSLEALQGLDAKSKEERAAIIRNSYKIGKEKLEKAIEQLNKIKSGKSRQIEIAPDESQTLEGTQ